MKRRQRASRPPGRCDLTRLGGDTERRRSASWSRRLSNGGARSDRTRPAIGTPCGDDCSFEERVLDETLVAGPISPVVSAHLLVCVTCRRAIGEILWLAFAPPTDEENQVLDQVLADPEWSQRVLGALAASREAAEISAIERAPADQARRAVRRRGQLRLVRG